MDRPRAIDDRISADGLRSPRSTCDRYGLLTPAARASSRSDTWAALRWLRMNSPTDEPTAGTDDATVEASAAADAAAVATVSRTAVTWSRTNSLGRCTSPR